MSRSSCPNRRGSVVHGLAVVVLLLLSACESVPVQRAELPPALQLLESATLVVPKGCAVDASVRVNFLVLENGRTQQVRAGEAPTCLKDALVAWVESFRYSPPSSRIEESVEWLLVTARRGS